MRGRVGLVVSSICTWWSSYIFVGNVPVLFYGEQVRRGLYEHHGSWQWTRDDPSDINPSHVALYFHQHHSDLWLVPWKI